MMKQLRVYGVGKSPTGDGYVILLMDESEQQCLPIFVGAFEAQAIVMELENSKAPRPLTHDLFKNVIEELEYSISKVHISELKDSTFYARLFLEKAGIETEIDARPSDSIALALKFDAPIYVAEEVMAVAGIEQEGKEKAETITMEDLNTQLHRAVENEEFELAARLRDQIKSLKNNAGLPTEQNERPSN
jgi:bifunctional DNase/RNase